MARGDPWTLAADVARGRSGGAWQHVGGAAAGLLGFAPAFPPRHPMAAAANSR